MLAMHDQNGMAKGLNFLSDVEMLKRIGDTMPHDFRQLKIVDDAFQLPEVMWHGVPNALQHLNVTKEVKSLRHPILVVHGEHDPILPIQGSRELAKTLQNAEFVEVKGHGHSLNVEDPKKFVQLLTDFFG